MKIFKIMFYCIVILSAFSMQLFALTKQPKVDTKTGSGEFGPCDFTYTTKVTFTDTNNDNIYDHCKIELTIEYDYGLLGKGKKTFTLYDNDFSFRGNNGNGYPNNDPLIDLELSDSLAYTYFQIEIYPNEPEDSMFVIKEYNFTFYEVQTESLVGFYSKNLTDSIPLYTNYKISTLNKFSAVERLITDDDELGNFVRSINRSFPIFCYPNPTKDNITIMIGDNSSNSDLAINTIKKFGLDFVDYLKIFDIKGKIVYKKEGPIYLQEFPINIPANTFETGTYFAEVRYAGKWKGNIKINIIK